MNKAEILRQLQQLRHDLERLAAAIQALPDATAAAATPAAPDPGPATVTSPAMPPAAPDAPSGATPSLLEVMDLSDPVRDVYLVLLKSPPMGMDELRQQPVLAAAQAEIPVLVRTLVRLGHVERVEEAGGVKYRAVAGHRGGRRVDDSIWSALDGS